jgi:hypothetical protein
MSPRSSRFSSAIEGEFITEASRQVTYVIGQARFHRRSDVQAFVDAANATIHDSGPRGSPATPPWWSSAGLLRR